MPPLGGVLISTDADTIRILVSTDNHVGYNERDPIRGDDSWKTFHEIMCLAKERDVDMVLLAGDLFHENNHPANPCIKSCAPYAQIVWGAFNHVNYEDLDINVAIPVFSIHGNHDDPSGEGHLAALDILQVSGLLNYYGRTPESDNIQVKPVLLQKGRTKLALYGLSNVRDERLFRTFRDGKVKFFQPSVQKEDWFNLICVHQNHHAYTETGYLPENFLPEFLDLVIWGHEHECLIDPKLNPETNCHVMQPGSSVATSLVPGEAVTKQPMKLARKENNRTEITRLLMTYVEDLIEQAKAEWLETHEDDIGDDEEPEIPLPLVRLRVETSTPDGGSFDCENPQRFSNRFVGKVANVNDVVQFHRKKKTTTSRKKDDLDAEAAVSHLSTLDTVKVEQLVRELLTAQSLTILPQNLFGDAVTQFVDKDDKHAMELFVNESLDSQIKHLLTLERDADFEDEDETHQSLRNAMEKYRGQMEDMFAKGSVKRTRGQKKFKPKPDGWDSEFDGAWEDQPGALIHSDNEGGDPIEEDVAEDGTERAAPSGRGRGRGRGGRGAATTTRKRATAATATATTKSGTASRGGRGKKTVVSDDDEDEDVVMVEDSMEEPEAIVSDEDDSQALFVQQSRGKKSTTTARKPAASTTTTASKSRSKKAGSPAPSSVTAGASSTRRGGRGGAKSTQQTTLNFASQASSTGAVRRNAARTARVGFTEMSDDEDDDDDDAFEPATITRKRR
uniref:Double-strand break repair protein n=1 Tax=Talaromyces marneffei TaxID=37727 RepID=Q0MR25_TALMA|nr:MRE11-like protein [Talaromyces marneffei]